MSNPFQVIDFETLAGQALKRQLEARVEELRAKLEDVALSERDTQATRGALAEIRKLLRPAPQHVATPRYSGMSFNSRGNSTV
jgi:hypothetical protein